MYCPNSFGIQRKLTMKLNEYGGCPTMISLTLRELFDEEDSPLDQLMAIPANMRIEKKNDEIQKIVRKHYLIMLEAMIDELGEKKAR